MEDDILKVHKCSECGKSVLRYQTDGRVRNYVIIWPAKSLGMYSSVIDFSKRFLRVKCNCGHMDNYAIEWS